MAKMTDPTDALRSFQEMLPLGILDLRPGELDPTLLVHADSPAPGVSRLTYVRIEGKVVTAMALFASCESIESRPCFALGYAVPPAYRGQGRAKEVVSVAMAEMRNGFGRAKLLPIYVEAIVGADNAASLRVAAKTVAEEAVPVTDSFSGLPAFQYLRMLS